MRSKLENKAIGGTWSNRGDVYVLKSKIKELSFISDSIIYDLYREFSQQKHGEQWVKLTKEIEREFKLWVIEDNKHEA